ncbi:DNA-binding CsgD family transcriptional regulator [Kutzneria viridogrisea]|uniref:DNA-binding CsgD family transcriptional regulator n=1 Tax=Kutzneria viridogrisea TaxID=47990 RepID=A0ABR6BS47_9PSEU|nr:DNA-binding CsgD family transcriptional regulator [Kutzneria viridogrisea]
MEGPGPWLGDPAPPAAVGRWRPLVGRAAELGKLEQAAARAFRLVELVGEPGIGKTRLLAEFVARVRRTGRLVLWGRAAAVERDVPFGPVVDALDDYIDERAAGGLSQAELRLLTGVFPALADGSRGERAASGAVRFRQYRAVRALLRSLARPPGLTIVLDDLHWADEPTIELIDYLVRHPLPDPVLIVLAYRPAQVSSRLTTALADAPQGQVCRVDLAPFTEAEADQLLAAEPSRTTRRRLHRRSGGNPFYLDALAQMVGAGEDPLPELPKSVHAALAAELFGLAAPASLVAQSAAVAGTEFEPALVACVAEIGEDQVLAALDELVARDLVRSVGWSGRFRFRHELVRHVAYGSAAAGWRHGAHTRLAEYLASVGASQVQRADHVLRSAKFGDTEAVQTLVGAARTAMSHAPASSVTWYEAALSLLSDGDEELPPRVQLQQELALSQGISGRLDQSRETLREVLRVLPPDQVSDRARAASFCAFLDYLQGEHELARHLLNAELGRQQDPHSAEATPLRMQLAMDLLLTGGGEDVRGLLADLPEGGDEGWTIPHSTLLAFQEAIDGNRFAAAQHVKHAADLLDVIGDEEFLSWLPAIYSLCWTEIATGRIASGLRHFTRAVDLARATGRVYLLAALLCGQACAYGLRGRIAEGQDALDEALDVARSFGYRSHGLLAGIACALSSWRGEHGAALRWGNQAVAETDPSRPWARALAHHHLLLAHVHASNPAACAALVAACGGPDLPEADPFTRLNCYYLLAACAAGQGDAELARDWARRAEEIADPRLELDVLFVELAGAHAASVEDPGRAAALALRAAESAEACGLALHQGAALLLAGTCLAKAARRDQAICQLRAAADLFSGCGASDLHSAAVREQRRLGIRVPTTGSRSKQRPHALSPREQDVAELVCSGLTNQQIAEKLVLSVRTVETHLTHIFAKLGVTNRAGVAGVLANQSTD